MTPEEIEALKKQVAEYEAAKAAHEARAAEAQQRAEAAERKAAELEAARAAEAAKLREQQIAQMPIEEQLKARQAAWEAQQAQQMEELRRQAAFQSQQAQEYYLTAYKENRLRVVGNELIPAMVSGNSPEEIDASILASQAAFRSIRDAARLEFEAQHRQQVAASIASAVPAPPPNPALAAPLPAVPVGTSPAAYPQQPPPSAAQVGFGGMSAEEAVRRGLYNKGNREQYMVQGMGQGPSVQSSRAGAMPDPRLIAPGPQPGYPPPSFPSYPRQPPPPPPPVPFYPPAPPPQPSALPSAPLPQAPQGYAPPVQAGPAWSHQAPTQAYSQQSPDPSALLAPMPYQGHGQNPGHVSPQPAPSALEADMRAALERVHAGANPVLGAMRTTDGQLSGQQYMTQVNQEAARLGVDSLEAAQQRYHNYFHPQQQPQALPAVPPT